jgi:hypothetical protein
MAHRAILWLDPLLVLYEDAARALNLDAITPLRWCDLQVNPELRADGSEDGGEVAHAGIAVLGQRA